MKRWDRLLTLIPPKTAVIADVGTDHGYLAINAIKNNHVKTVYATDISQEPLNSAIKNIDRTHPDVKKRIHLFKSDGLDFLKKIPKTEIDYVVVAGLGTKKIHEIVNQPDFKIKNYLLLSNTEISKLRYWAQLNNFWIQKEDFFYDRQKPYWLILINTDSNFESLENFEFGDWNRWYKDNKDYQKYLSALKKRHSGYNNRIMNPEDLLKNKQYIKEIENYLKQWN